MHKLIRWLFNTDIGLYAWDWALELQYPSGAQGPQPS